MKVEKLLKEKDVQDILSVSRTYLWRLRKEGKIKFLTQGGNRIYYRASDVADYIDSLGQIEDSGQVMQG